jgi:hypothetical protein
MGSFGLKLRHSEKFQVIKVMTVQSSTRITKPNNSLRNMQKGCQVNMAVEKEKPS